VRQRGSITGLPECRPVPLVEIEGARTHGEHVDRDQVHDAVAFEPPHHLRRDPEATELRPPHQSSLAPCELDHHAVH